MPFLCRYCARFIAFITIAFFGTVKINAQTFPFNSGSLYLCDTSYFYATVPSTPAFPALCTPCQGGFPPGQIYSVMGPVQVDIISSHPQTLAIYLAHGNDTLPLSLYNGAGGVNYTACSFANGYPSITTGSAPFTGTWAPQGPGDLTVFDGSAPNGTWTLIIVDTMACATNPPPGTVSGTFNGSASGGITIGVLCNDFYMQTETYYTCPGVYFDLNTIAVNTFGPSHNVTFYGSGGLVPNPYAVNPGSYTLVNIDLFTGCLTELPVVILPGTTTISLGNDSTFNLCPGNTIDLTGLYPGASGGTLDWTFGGNPVASPSAVAANGIYVGVYTEPSGCTDTVEITINAVPGISIGPDQTIAVCNGTATDLTAFFSLSGSTQTWALNGSPVTVATAQNAVAGGIYQVIATFPGGCADTAEVTYNVNPAVVLGPDLSISGCVPGAYDLTQHFNTAGLTAVWTLNGGTPVMNPSAVVVNGLYTLVAASAAGCSDTANLQLNVSVKPNLGPDKTIDMCAGDTANLTGLYTPGLNAFSWTFNGNPVANPSAITNGGVYMLVATSLNGCKDTALVTVNSQPPPVLGAPQSHSICSNESFDLTAAYNTSGYTTSWTFNGTAVVTPSAVNVPGVYSLYATAGAGCSDSVDLSLMHLNTPQLGPDQVTGICDGNAASLVNLYNTAGYTAAWTFGGNIVNNPAAVTVAGLYALIAIAPTGCADTAAVTVNVGTKPNLGTDQSLINCEGVVVDLTALFSTVGLSSSWTINATPVVNPSSITQSGMYQLIAANATGCADTAIASVMFLLSPNLGPDLNIGICDGAPADLTAPFNLVGLSASWSINGVPEPDPANVTVPGTYMLVVVNNNNCTDTVLVTVNSSPGPNIGPDQYFTLCPWQNIDLSSLFNGAGLTADYTFKGNSLSNITAVHDSGIYTILVTDANGCTDEMFVNVSWKECICTADFLYDANCIQEPVAFEIVTDSVLTAAHWVINNGSYPDQFVFDPVILFRSEGVVTVKLEATMTCGSVIVEKEITIEDCSDSCSLYIPTAFSPNKDAKNDYFRWKSDCDPDPGEYAFEIYNRFGQLVFQSDNPVSNWDGKYNNADAPEGVYVYRLQIKLPYQKKDIITSSFYLIR